MKILYKKVLKILFEIFYGKILKPIKSKLNYEDLKIIDLKFYNKNYNSTIVSQFFVDITFNLKNSYHYKWYKKSV